MDADHIEDFFGFPTAHPLAAAFAAAQGLPGLPAVLEACLDNGHSQRIEGECHSSVRIMGNVVICAGSRVAENVVIHGPAFIGPAVCISPNVHIRPGSWIGAGVRIGCGSEVKRAICLDESRIASGAFVGDSILGFGARIGSGAILANRRFDQRNVALVLSDGTRHATAEPLFGAILGDYVRIGANAVLCPGAVVGAYSWIGPGVVLSGRLEAARSMFVRQDLVVRPITPRRLRAEPRDASPGRKAMP